MTLKLSAVAAFLLLTFASNAQESNVKFGRPDLSEVAMKTYDADTAAEAVVLFDRAMVDIRIDDYSNSLFLKFTETRHQRIKILKASALNRGIVKLPYYRTGTPTSSQLFKEVRGFTYNWDGKIITEEKLGRNDMTDEKGTKNYYVKQLSFPNVKVGSVIDIEYTIETPFEVSNNPETWYFQRDIPTKWSEYAINIPGYFYYQMLMGGYLPLAVNEQKPKNMSLGVSRFDTQGIAYRFVVKDAPAFKDEPYITTEEDYYSKIDFELASYTLPDGISKVLSTTWPDLDQTLIRHERFGQQLNRSNFLKDEVNEFMKIKDATARAEAIYGYMLKNYKWDEYVGIFTSDNLRKIYTDKKGNVAEINLLMINLLNECDIDAQPVLLSTRSHGKMLKSYALMNRFNYVIAAIPNGDTFTFLDATDPTIPFGGLPARCLNETGRRINMKGIGDFVPITTFMEHSQFETLSARLDVESGTLAGNYRAAAGGYVAHDLREQFKDTKPENAKKEIQAQNPEWEINDFEVKNGKQLSDPFEVLYKFKQQGVASPGIIYLDPMLQGKIKENPFKSKVRNFPVDFGHRTMLTYAAEFEIPEGYVIDEKPEPVMISLPDKGGRFIYSLTVVENKLKVMSQVRLSKAVYYADEYPYLKEFYSQIVQKHAEQVVLKEK